MNRKTDEVQPKERARRGLDAFDRRLLGALTADATQSYAALGEAVALSAPAVHERVRQLRNAGVIRRTRVEIDPVAIGKPLLAFILVEAAGWGKSERLMRIARFPEVEEMHSVTGDASMIVKARCASPQALENLLAQIHAVPGVSGTRSSIALSTFLERGVQAGVTQEWPGVDLQDYSGSPSSAHD